MISLATAYQNNDVVKLLVANRAKVPRADGMEGMGMVGGVVSKLRTIKKFTVANLGGPEFT